MSPTEKFASKKGNKHVNALKNIFERQDSSNHQKSAHPFNSSGRVKSTSQNRKGSSKVKIVKTNLRLSNDPIHLESQSLHH